MAKRKAKEKPTTVDISPGVTMKLGDLVSFYSFGWRYGYLEEIKEKTVVVRPIGPKNGAIPRSVTVEVGDVKRAE